MDLPKVIHNSIFYITAGICATFLIFPKLASILIILLFISYVINKGPKGNLNILFQINLVTLAIGLFLLHVIGLTYTDDLATGLFVIEKRLSLLALPLILGTSRRWFNERETLLLLLLIGLSSLFVVLIIYTEHLFIRDVPFMNLLSLERNELTDIKLIKIDHPYLGLSISFSLVCFLKLIYDSPSRLTKFLFTTTFIILLLFLIQLNAKMATISFFAALIFYFLFSLKKLFWGSLILILVSLVIIFATDFFTLAVHNLAQADGGSRLRNWEVAWEAVKQSPIIGYGTGDTEFVLQSFRNSNSWEYQMKYNSHNQYLALILMLGIFGLISYLFVLGAGFKLGYKRKAPLLCCFIIIFFLCSFTEVLLARFHGIVFFSLVVGIFANHLFTNRRISL